MGIQVTAVSASGKYTFSKPNQASIQLVQGIGVFGDAHAGKTVQHRYLQKKDPTQPNLRQIHLIHAELFDALLEDGFHVLPGQLGENITTRGIDLLQLPTGTRLLLGQKALVEITGLRNPCKQIDQFQPGLLAKLLVRDEKGRVIRKAGVMGIVLSGGTVAPDDPIQVTLPPEPHQPLAVV